MAAAEQPQLRNLFDRPLNLKHMPNPQSIYIPYAPYLSSINTGTPDFNKKTCHLHAISQKKGTMVRHGRRVVCTLTLHDQYSVVLGKKAMSHSNTKGVDMSVLRRALGLSPAYLCRKISRVGSVRSPFRPTPTNGKYRARTVRRLLIFQNPIRST